MATRSVPAPVALAAAWGGAVLFAASLLYFLHTYLIGFEAPAPSGPRLGPALVDVALFSVFALHHSLFARSALKAWVRRIIPPELERSLYTWISSALLAVVCWAWQPVPGDLYRLTGAAGWLCATVQAAGLLLTFLGSRALDVLDLAGVRPVLLARAGRTAGHVPLKTTGIYAVVRHPLYFGWALLVFGTAHMTGTRLVFALVSTAYLALAIPFEERHLIATFGADYEAYRARVRWRMLPGVY